MLLLLSLLVAFFFFRYSIDSLRKCFQLCIKVPELKMLFCGYLGDEFFLEKCDHRGLACDDSWESLKDPIGVVYLIYLNQKYESESLASYTENGCWLNDIEKPPVINKITTLFLFAFLFLRQSTRTKSS